MREREAADLGLQLQETKAKLSDQLETWVRSVYFVNFITFVIVLAGAIVGAQTYPSIEYDPHLRAMINFRRERTTLSDLTPGAARQRPEAEAQEAPVATSSTQ